MEIKIDSNYLLSPAIRFGSSTYTDLLSDLTPKEAIIIDPVLELAPLALRVTDGPLPEGSRYE